MTPDPRLMLPATRALLDGWCGPVVLDARDTVFRGLHGRAQVFCEDYDGGDEDAWVPLADIAESRLRIDLSRAECRDRVARVVSLAAGLVSPVPLWYRSNSSRPPHGEWSLGGSWPTMTTFSGLGGMGGAIRCVPALAGLDPNDDTRLPDGERLVDALALAAVARQVLGGTP